MPYTSSHYPQGVPKFILKGFDDPGVMIVSGGGPNPYGHAILRLGDDYAGYAHVHEVYNYPEFLTPQQFRDYRRSEGKLIWGEIPVRVPDLPLARAMLNALAKVKWFWKGNTDNCADFCTTVLNAGGANLPNNLSNLPSAALQQAILGSVQNWNRPSVGPQTVLGEELMQDLMPI